MINTSVLGKNRVRGFTMVELMIVVVVVGILAAVVVVGITGLRREQQILAAYRNFVAG